MIWRRTTHRNDPHRPPTTLDTLRAIESRVRPDLRRTMIFGGIALAALIAGYEIGGVHAASARVRFAAYGCAALVGVFGVAASRTAAGELRRLAIRQAGDAAAAPVRVAVLLVGYMIAAISFCDLLDVNVGHLLIGGAITGIVVGLAAQPVLGNLFAGLVLLFARPYLPGQQIRVLSGSINGPHEGVVTSAGLLYTTLQTAVGPLNIPNSALLAAAVGPAVELPPAGSTEEDGGSARTAATDVDPTASTGDDADQKARDLATAVAEGVATGEAGASGRGA